MGQIKKWISFNSLKFEKVPTGKKIKSFILWSTLVLPYHLNRIIFFYFWTLLRVYHFTHPAQSYRKHFQLFALIYGKLQATIAPEFYCSSAENVKSESTTTTLLHSQQQRFIKNIFHHVDYSLYYILVLVPTAEKNADLANKKT